MGLPEDESKYFFNGFRFAEFVDVPKFKKEVLKALNIECKENLDLGSFYEFVLNEKPASKDEMDRILFENILYSHLKNAFVIDIASHPSLGVDLFKKKVKGLIEEINHKETIPSNHHRFMTEKGFYLMDSLNISVPNTKFIAGFDFTEKNKQIENVRFLFVEVVPQKQKMIYFLAGIDINFKEKVGLVLIKRINGLSKEDEETDTTVHQLYNQVLQKVLTTLNIQTSGTSVNSDRAGMYNFCKGLDEKLLSDIRLHVNSTTSFLTTESVNKLNKALFPKEKRLNIIHKKELSEKVKDLLLSYYIDYNISPKELVSKAKSLNLVGYSTKIKFMSTKSSRSSTQSSSSKHPVSASDMFHSLYSNFKQALELEKLSICWFTDYQFTDPKDLDVIQTTIHITKNNFHIVFHPTRPLNKEIIYYVIRTINSYR